MLKMKDNVRGTLFAREALPFIVAILAAGCGRASKTADVAQDSLLIKNADVRTHRMDTTVAAPGTLVRDRGSAADAPSLTAGAPVKRAPDVRTSGSPAMQSASPQPKMQPPAGVNPTPVLPGRVLEPSPTPNTDTTRDTTAFRSSSQ